MINDITTSTLGASVAPSFLSRNALHNACPAAFAEKPHERVSEKYRFVSTIEVVDKLEEYGYLPISASNPMRKANGAKGKSELVESVTGPHVIRFEPSTTTTIGPKQEGRVQLVLINSHDRTRRFELSAGFHRLVCSNGLVAYSPEASVIATHIKSEADAIYSAIEGAITKAGKLLTTIRAMQKVSLSKQRQTYFAKQAMAIRFGNESLWRIEPKQLLAPRREEDQGDDLWRVFNRVQENLIRGGISNGRTPMPTFPLTAPRQEYRVNKSLWQLAEEMAAK